MSRPRHVSQGLRAGADATQRGPSHDDFEAPPIVRHTQGEVMPDSMKPWGPRADEPSISDEIDSTTNVIADQDGAARSLSQAPYVSECVLAEAEAVTDDDTAA